MRAVTLEIVAHVEFRVHCRQFDCRLPGIVTEYLGDMRGRRCSTRDVGGNNLSTMFVSWVVSVVVVLAGRGMELTILGKGFTWGHCVPSKLSLYLTSRSRPLGFRAVIHSKQSLDKMRHITFVKAFPCFRSAASVQSVARLVLLTISIRQTHADKAVRTEERRLSDRM